MNIAIDFTTIVLQRKIEDTVEAAMLFQPHVVVTVDSKGFSFRLLRQLKSKAIKGSIFLYLLTSKYAEVLMLSRQMQSKGSKSFSCPLCGTVILGLERW
jgi:hypothetical protein